MLKILKRLFDGRGLLAAFRDMLAAENIGGPVSPDPVAEVRELRAQLVERIRAGRQIEIERNCFRDALRGRGVSPKAMAMMVKLYDQQLRISVGVRRQA